MKTNYVNELNSGMNLSEETFVIVESKAATDKNGNSYYDLVLGDKTGQIKAKIWSNSIGNVEKDALKSGRVVAVNAVVDEFRGKPQINVNKLMGVDEAKLEEFMESSSFSAEEMWQELQARVESMQDPHLQKFLQNLLQDEKVSKRLQIWPAANSIHHSFRSGLLQHILEMLTLADGLVKYYDDVNFDIVTAGIVIHDIGKLVELDGSGIVTQYTKVGSLLGHMLLGIELIEPFYPQDFPEEYRVHLKHIILSHHGAKELGSPVLPATTEAMLVSDIDVTSSNARKASTAVGKNLQEDGMTEFDWRMGVRYWDGVSVE